MQKLSAIVSDTNLTAPSVNTVNSSKGSGDFQKLMTDMKDFGNGKKAAVTGKTGTVQKKNAVMKQSDIRDNVDDKVPRITQKASQESVVSRTDMAAEDFTQNDLLQAENEVKNIVKDILEIDEDTFGQTIASMGITAMQLLDPNVLQQFVVQMNGGNDATDLLTNEEMMLQFSELSASLTEIDWEQLTGFTGEQLSHMTTDSFDDSGLLQKLINGLDGTAVDAGEEAVAEDVSKAEEQGIPPQKEDLLKISRADESVTVSDDISETAMTENSTEALAATDTGENFNRQMMAENVGLSEKNSQEKIPAANEDTVLMSLGDSGDNVADAGNDAQMQNAFQNGSEAEGRSDSMASYFEDSPAAVTESQTILNFVENMVQASNVEQVQEPVNMQQMIDIVNQVVERVHSSLQDETTTLEMQLNPERLGKMLLTVSSKEGVMTASITVQNAEAKAALESQMITLRENLEQKNLKVEAVEVSVSDFAFSQSGQADTGDQKNYQQGNGKRARFQYDSEDEEVESSQGAEEQVRRSAMMDLGSSVDFTA